MPDNEVAKKPKAKTKSRKKTKTTKTDLETEKTTTNAHATPELEALDESGDIKKTLEEIRPEKNREKPENGNVRLREVDLTLSQAAKIVPRFAKKRKSVEMKNVGSKVAKISVPPSAIPGCSVAIEKMPKEETDKKTDILKDAETNAEQITSRSDGKEKDATTNKVEAKVYEQNFPEVSDLTVKEEAEKEEDIQSSEKNTAIISDVKGRECEEGEESNEQNPATFPEKEEVHQEKLSREPVLPEETCVVENYGNYKENATETKKDHIVAAPEVTDISGPADANKMQCPENEGMEDKSATMDILEDHDNDTKQEIKGKSEAETLNKEIAQISLETPAPTENRKNDEGAAEPNRDIKPEVEPPSNALINDEVSAIMSTCMMKLEALQDLGLTNSQLCELDEDMDLEPSVPKLQLVKEDKKENKAPILSKPPKPKGLKIKPIGQDKTKQKEANKMIKGVINELAALNNMLMKTKRDIAQYKRQRAAAQAQLQQNKTF